MARATTFKDAPSPGSVTRAPPQSPTSKPARSVPAALAAFVLDVLGGIGAVWGCAEVFAVRDERQNDTWRIISTIVGVLCAMRWCAIFILKWPVLPDIEALAGFLLQVLGGVGAIWGLTEIVGLRVNYPKDCHDSTKYFGVGRAWAPGYESCMNTYSTCRIATLAALPFFFVWWQRDQLFAAHLQHRSGRVVSCFSTFVLQVIGAAGAVWGASEVAGPSGRSLRLGWGDRHFGQESFDFWRWCCAATFALFLCRWVALLETAADEGQIEESKLGERQAEVLGQIGA